MIATSADFLAHPGEFSIPKPPKLRQFSSRHLKLKGKQEMAEQDKITPKTDRNMIKSKRMKREAQQMVLVAEKKVLKIEEKLLKEKRNRLEVETKMLETEWKVMELNSEVQKGEIENEELLKRYRQLSKDYNNLRTKEEYWRSLATASFAHAGPLGCTTTPGLTGTHDWTHL